MKASKAIFLLLLFIVISDTITYIGGVIGFENYFFTPISLVLKYLALFILIYIAKRSNWKSDIPNNISLLLKIVLVWNVVTILRGIFFAIDYWDIKFLFGSSLLFFLIPLAFFIGKNLSLTRLVIKYSLRYLFRFSFLFIPITLLTNHELYSRLVIPVSIFIIFIPYLKPHWRLLVLIVAAVSILLVIDFRANIIKTGLSLLFVSLYYFRRYISLFWLKTGRVLIFLIPLILLVMAISGSYNIFAETGKKSYTIKTDKNVEGKEANFAADTRTFLYVDVFNSLIKDGDILIGKGASGKYKTDYFDTLGDHRGRYGAEVGFLNILLYSGIVGVVLYLLMLLLASYYAIFKSNNFLSKMIGLLLACRWLMFFIEEFTNFDLNNLYVWIIIGMVSSLKFRSLSDDDLKLFFRM